MNRPMPSCAFRVSTVALNGTCEELILNLVFAVHCHQPLGNFDAVINEACDRAYLPFLEVLAAHPDLRINLHYSGSLLEWLDSSRPDVLEELESRRDQIEWLGGAFYDPILPSIPVEDGVAQILRHTRYLKDRFDSTPRGIWLAERVWDPGLPALLQDVGMEYTLVDDYAFLLAGYAPDDLTGAFVADHLGVPVTIFPISQGLRYAVPDTDPEDVLATLRRRHEDDPDSLVVIADDGEKYGLWPDSFERVYPPGNWLDEFFTLIGKAAWLEITTFEKHLDGDSHRRKIAIPPASYREMSQWSLPEQTVRRAGSDFPSDGYADWGQTEAYLRGGWWPNFLVEYPEAAVLYRKMLRVSAHVAASKASSDAQTELLKAQGNDPYWHGGFGGLYFPHLRAEANRHLITAQMMIDVHHHRGRSWTYLRHLDWDADGREEIQVEMPDQSWVVDPGEGGSLLYFDDKPTRWSIGDVVARRFEPYHRELPKPQVYDPHPRRWLTDHLLGASVTAQAFSTSEYEELVPLFSSDYEVESASEGRGSAKIVMTGLDGKVKKAIEAIDRSLRIGYELTDLPGGNFGPEIPVAVWAGAGQIRVDGGAWQEIDEPLALAGHRFRVRHGGLNASLLIVLRQPGEVFLMPLRTTTRGDTGMASILQGVVLWPHWASTGEGNYEMTIEIGETTADES